MSVKRLKLVQVCLSLYKCKCLKYVEILVHYWMCTWAETSLTLTQILRKSWEKDRKISPIFSKIKWECFCQNWRSMRKLGKIVCLFSWFSQDFCQFMGWIKMCIWYPHPVVTYRASQVHWKHCILYLYVRSQNRVYHIRNV